MEKDSNTKELSLLKVNFAHKRIISTLFRDSPVSASSQNHPYSKKVHFGMVHSIIFQYQYRFPILDNYTIVT